MTEMSEEEIRKVATSRVQARKSFYAHLTAYVIINLMLIAIWYFTGAHYFWPMWVLIFWGVGLIINGVTVFVGHGTGWEKREIEKEIAKIKKSGN